MEVGRDPEADREQVQILTIGETRNSLKVPAVAGVISFGTFQKARCHLAIYPESRKPAGILQRIRIRFTSRLIAGA